MTLTTSMPVVAQYLKDKLEANKGDLNLQDVFYGDQNKIPRVPAAVVEPEGKTRELVGAPQYTEVRLTTYILIYHAGVQDVQVTRKECDEAAERVEFLINSDLQMGQYPDSLVVHGFVTQIESGYTYRNNTLFRTSRLTHSAVVRKQMP